MRIAGVIFDLDGTLIDSASDIAASVNAVRASFGREPLPAATVRGYIGDGIENLLSRCLAGEEVPRALDLYREHHRAHLLDRTTLYPGIEALLADLAAAGRPLAIVTNKPRGYARTIVEGLGVAHRFAAVVGGDGPSGKKPSPGPFEEALAAIGVAKAEAIVVGDGRNDVLGARAAGLPIIGVLYGIGDADEVRALGPDHLASSVEEVRAIVLGDGRGRARCE